MEMEDQYGIPDLRQFMTGASRSSHFPPTVPQPIDLFSGYRNLTSPPLHHHQYDLMMMPTRQVLDHMMPRQFPDHFRSNSTTASATTVAAVAATTTTTASVPALSSGFEVDTGSFGGDCGSGRWPRQETLSLLEIRTRLDSKFKEANQKGPLWDEVSRIMSEEHGYQRSGKKCREKFENLYKYYKKTREGKSGRQDGKHYRFFRQLEALYGESTSSISIPPETNFITESITTNTLQFNPLSTNTPQQLYQYDHKLFDNNSLSLSNDTSSEFGTSSSDDRNDSCREKRRKSGRSRGKCWKKKIKEFIDSHMRKLAEKQEAWLEKLMRTIEQKEKERMVREEEWRKQEAIRLEKEHRFWADEKAWIEARDSTLIKALQKISRQDLRSSSCLDHDPTDGDQGQKHEDNRNEDESEILNYNKGNDHDGWGENEITKLIELRSEIESRCGDGDDDQGMILWEEISSKMGCLGYERNALMCKEKWKNINYHLRIKSKDIQCCKKRKENYYSKLIYNYSQYHDQSSLFGQSGSYCEVVKDQGAETARVLQINGGSSPNSSNVGGNVVQETSFRFLMGEGETNLWENYEMKMNNKLGDHQN